MVPENRAVEVEYTVCHLVESACIINIPRVGLGNTYVFPGRRDGEGQREGGELEGRGGSEREAREGGRRGQRERGSKGRGKEKRREGNNGRGGRGAERHVVPIL